jgi:hypothetical protein
MRTLFVGVLVGTIIFCLSRIATNPNDIPSTVILAFVITVIIHGVYDRGYKNGQLYGRLAAALDHLRVTHEILSASRKAPSDSTPEDRPPAQS